MFGSKELLVVPLLLLGLTQHCLEGSCNVDHCSNSTTCILSKDQRSCRCASGYYSDQCDRNADVKVICGKDFITIRALEDYFKYHNVPMQSLHLPNKSCNAQREVIDGVPYYMSRISRERYLECGGKPLEKNFTHILYSLSLLSEPQVTGNIIRDPVIKMDFTCVYPYTRTVSLPFPIVPFSTETVMRVDDLDATVQLMLYTNRYYTKAYSSSPAIELRDKVYVELIVAEPADFFLLLVDECWATQFSQPNTTGGSVHTLLQNGCARDRTLSFLNTTEGLGHNGGSSTIHFSFDVFRFTTEPHELFLHCTVQLCEPIDHKSCTPSCNSVSKREAVRAGPTQGLLSYGPIRVEIPHSPPSSSLMAVVLPVATVWTVGVFLIIIIAVAKAGNKKLAPEEESRL